MLDDKGFDLWANGYDKSVGLFEDSEQYPFAGYKGVLNGIYNRVRENHELWEHLETDGKILIGDVAFETKDKLTACQTLSGASWDKDEIYIVYSELVKHIPFGKLEFILISHCAGIVTISK